MSAYSVVKWLHILSAAAWFGGGAGLLALQLRVASSRDAAAQTTVATHAAALGGRYYGAASALTLLTGIGGVVLGEWSFTSTWVLVGFAGVLASGALAGTLGARTERAMAAAVTAGGPESTALEPLHRRERAIAVAHLVLLAVVMYVMVTKPA